ncbi:MAG: FtsB family cell division protein [Gammaproteobacteria bacterium]
MTDSYRRLGLNWLIAGLLLLIVLLGWLLIYGKSGWLHRAQVQAEIELLETENAQLRNEIALTQLRLDAIKTDPRALEEAARSRLGLVGESEEIYWIEQQSRQDTGEPHSTFSDAPESP